MNPRILRAKFPLNPDEKLEVLQIPLGPLTAHSVFPFSIAIEYWLRDQKSGRQSLVIQQPPSENDITFVFQPGEARVDCSADGGFAQVALKWPQDGVLEGLLMTIAQHPNPSEFGVVDLGPDEGDSASAIYRPHLAQSGINWAMNRASLANALVQLVDSGWLEAEEGVGEINRYRLSDAAKADHLFLYQVGYFKKRREQDR